MGFGDADFGQANAFASYEAAGFDRHFGCLKETPDV